MKYYSYCYPGEYGETVWETLNEDDIIKVSWDSWYNIMCKNHSKDFVDANFTKQDCINDWIISHWAIPNTWREMKEGVA